MRFVASTNIHRPPVFSLPKAAPHPFIYAFVCITMLGLGRTIMRLTVGIFSIQPSQGSICQLHMGFVVPFV